MNTTKILGEQSGIQYQGVSDKSEANPTDALVNFVLAGEFVRGRFDRPMKITKANIRSKLGFDPTNIQYQAVEDTLNTGAPFVWVQRVSGESAVQFCQKINTGNSANFVTLQNIGDVEAFRSSYKVWFENEDGEYEARLGELELSKMNEENEIEYEIWYSADESYFAMKVCASVPFDLYTLN